MIDGMIAALLVSLCVAILMGGLAVMAVAWIAMDGLCLERALRRRALRECLAADLILAIEEDAAATTARASVEISARDKALRFFEAAQREPELRDLRDDELLQLLRSTLPKLSLGAFADGRGRLEAITT